VLLSLTAVIVFWPLATAVLRRAPSLVALAFTALNGELVWLAARGLREELVMILLIAFALSLLRSTLRDGSSLTPAIPVALLAVVRWELSLFALGILAVAALRRGTWKLPVVALLLSAVLAGPWLLSNARHYGDPFYHSNLHATFYRNEDLKAAGVEVTKPYQGPSISWSSYYLRFLGPQEALRRELVGLPTLALNLPYHSVFPIREARLQQLLSSSRAADALVAALRLLASIAAVLVWAVIPFAITRREGRAPLVAIAVAIFAGLAAYAPLSAHLDYRLVSFTLPFLGILFAAGVEAALHAVARSRTTRSAS
jgi:hypothetical protein